MPNFVSAIESKHDQIYIKNKNVEIGVLFINIHQKSKLARCRLHILNNLNDKK
jgi:hypothetical protein